MDKTIYILLAGIIVYVGVLAVGIGPLDKEPEPEPPGSAHAHLLFAVSLNGERIDFSQERYQLADRRVHFENKDGEILHIHAKQVTIEYTLDSLGIDANTSCIAVDKRRCGNSTHELRIYVDGERIDDPFKYVLKQDDNVMVWFGQKDERPDDEFFQRVLPDRFRPRNTGERV